MANLTHPETGRAVSRRAAIDAKCRDCAGSEGGDRHWRQYVGICQITDCSLWPVRPLPRIAPKWLRARNPDRLPRDWRQLPVPSALRLIRGPQAVDDAETASMAQKKG